ADLPNQSVTLHRLLGLGRFSNVPRFNKTNPLAYDVVIVDEASMVDLAMMTKLVCALKPEARLILLGDRDQLASVESGAVLADCIDSLPGNTVTLKKSYRFSAAIGDFAGAVREGDADRSWALCSTPEGGAVSLAGSDWLEDIVAVYRHHMERAAGAIDLEAYASLLGQFNSFRVLCALRRGRRGVEQINHDVESKLVDLKEGLGREWYRGRPVIITRNDNSLGLYNGDIGICLPDPSKGELRVWFESANSGLRSFLPGQLPGHETAWALTIHKSQGSEFDDVHVVLPQKDTPVLCRELLYTAITRARNCVRLVLSEEICRMTVSRKTDRHSGLADRLK
ncbi:MAG: exodeoxyribonuclease V subunit alpha, partial [Desulfofustis sp.]